MDNTLNDCIVALNSGEMILLIDDFIEGKEIGYFYLLSDFVTPSSINLMATHGRGLVSVALTKQRASELTLPMMVNNNENPHKYFTVSVDYTNCSTGISAFERCETIQKLTEKNSAPNDFTRPGHIFPIISSERGLLEQVTISDAAIDLAQLCSAKSLSGVVCDVLNKKGMIANKLELENLSMELNLIMVSMKNLVVHQLRNTDLILRQKENTVPTKYGELTSIIYTNQLDDSKIIVIMKEKKNKTLPLPVYIDSVFSIGEAFEEKNIEKITIDGFGILIYKLNSSKESRLDSRNPFQLKEFFGIFVEQILNDINITDPVIITNVA